MLTLVLIVWDKLSTIRFSVPLFWLPSQSLSNFILWNWLWVLTWSPSSWNIVTHITKGFWHLEKYLWKCSLANFNKTHGVPVSIANSKLRKFPNSQQKHFPSPTYFLNTKKTKAITIIIMIIMKKLSKAQKLTVIYLLSMKADFINCFFQTSLWFSKNSPQSHCSWSL